VVSDIATSTLTTWWSNVPLEETTG
jgi:hypothetical protein